MSEIWKDIPSYEGYYQVSNYGRVRSLNRVIKGILYKGKLLKQQPARGGYLHIGLAKNGIIKMCYIHRLVAMSFVGGYFDGALVNHRDENRKNNNASNLEWCTKSYNLTYGSAAQSNRVNKGISINQYTKEGELLHTYGSMAEAAEKIRKPVQNIWAVCKGLKKTCGGYVWKYNNFES